VQDVNDLMQRLTDIWTAVEESTDIGQRRRRLRAFEPQRF